jgi:hypothetical protein
MSLCINIIDVIKGIFIKKPLLDDKKLDIFEYERIELLLSDDESDFNSV